MKKKIIVLLILAVAVAFTAFAQADDAEVYTFVYGTAATYQAQLDILKSMEEAKLTGLGEFYAGALRTLLSNYSNIGTDPTERYSAAEQARLLSVLLGNEKHTEAAATVWQVVNTFGDPLIKADAIVALGEMQALEYLPHVIRTLDNLNVDPPSDPREWEKVAFGVIVALEKYQEPSGYLPVYIVSTENSWYSYPIKEQAKKSLPLIAEDPIPYMTSVLTGTVFGYPVKLTAVQAIDAADHLNDSQKGEIAVVAFSESWRIQGNNQTDRDTITTIRKLAISMVSRYKATDEAVYPLLNRSFTSPNTDISEKYDVINTLVDLGTDDAARQLSQYLMELNEKRQVNNISQADEAMVRRLIPALGRTKNSLCRASLIRVGILDWTPFVKNLARDALREIGS